MSWIFLVIAGLLEMVWAIALKHSEGFTKLWPSVIFIVSAWLSFAFLSYALKSIPMGNAYAVWTGIGAVSIAIVGIVWYGEPSNFLRIFCIALIIVGIVGLKIFGSSAV